MCHLILLLPIIALPVFWLWSWPIALGVYVLVLILSAWTYLYAIFAMRRPVVIGMERTLHSQGTVVDDTAGGLRVRVNSEYWPAQSEGPLHTGEPVRVIGREGLTLLVVPASPRPDTDGGLQPAGGRTPSVSHH